MLKKIILLIVLALLIAGGIWFYWKEEQKGQADAGTIIVYGNIDIRDVALGFRVSGRIAQLFYEEGDRVNQGDVVAALDPEPFQNDVDLYAAQVEQAEIVKKKLEKPYLRRERLNRSGAISTEERDDAKAAFDEADAQLKTARASLRQAITRLNDTEILSPSNGVILTRVREPGAIVAAGETVYTLALDDPVWVRAYVAEPDLGRIYPGQKASILTDSGGNYTGQIGFISPQAEFTPKNVETTQLRTDLVYRLRVIVDNPDHGLRQGMPVTVNIAVPTPPAER